MSEYWKSTPKYWCKHCKTYVRDTKLEKANHEATPKHQGNLKRFLRDLHRGHEKDEKDKERAKSEVARLNGLVSGGASGSNTSFSSSGFGRGPVPSLPKPQATPAQKKQQLTQLAEMGVSIPDEFRPDMAMAGEWQVTSENIIDPGNGEKKPGAIALGVRKRAVEDNEEEVLEAKKTRWGSAYKTHSTEEDGYDLDALLSNTIGKGKEPATKIEVKKEKNPNIKEDPDSISTKEAEKQGLLGKDMDHKDENHPVIKRESSDRENTTPLIPTSDTDIKQEGYDENVPGIVFKKRKAKNIRQK